MSVSLTEALSDPGPHTVSSLAERMPHFPADTIHAALEVLAAQGVLARENTESGEAAYRYVAPDRYAQADWEVIKNPGARHNGRPR